MTSFPGRVLRVRRAASVLLLVASTFATAALAEETPYVSAQSSAPDQASVTLVDAASASASAPVSAPVAAPASATPSSPASVPTMHTPTSKAVGRGLAGATARPADSLRLQMPGGEAGGQTALALRIVIGLTLLAVLPSLLICMTSFLRIIIVLSMLRQALGMAETPPNQVLIGLSLFLTLFTMQPVFQVVNRDAFQPFMAGRIDVPAATERAGRPLREFMVRQTREHDLALMVEISHATTPRTIDDVGFVQLVPAFVLSELRAAFQIGFVVFLPFLLIDLIVSSVLMALGMMMMPPVTVALPLKVLMFVLVDGWSLLLRALVESFR